MISVVWYKILQIAVGKIVLVRCRSFIRVGCWTLWSKIRQNFYEMFVLNVHYP